MALLPNQMLQPAFLTGAVQEKPSKEAIRQSYRALTLLPWEDVPERQVLWDVIYSENNLAGFYAPDGMAIPGDEVLFTSMMTNLIDVKAARNLDSWAVQQLRDAGMPRVYKAGGSSNTVQGMQGRLRDHINKRLAWCNEVVDAQIEYIGMHALQGTVVWPPVDQDGNAISVPMPHWNADMTITVPFNLPAAQNQNASTLTGWQSATGGGAAWTNHTTGDPIKDLMLINQYMIKTKGVSMRGGRLIMSQVVVDHMAQCANVLKWLVGTDYTQTGTREFIDEDTLKAIIKTRTGYTIETYDAQWTYRTKVPHTKPTIQRVDFMKEGKVLILPQGETVGTMMDTQLENMDGSWVYRKMGWSHRADLPPFPIQLGVNATAWPKFTQYDHFVLDAYA